MRENIASLPDGVKIDTVIHCAADVSHFGVGNRIQTNVDGVRNVIVFCKQHDAALIHISTLSVAALSSVKWPRSACIQRATPVGVRQDLSNDYL